MGATGFGANFLNSGKFGKKGRRKIRQAGFSNVKSFLDSAGLNGNNATSSNLQSALNAGPVTKAVTPQPNTQAGNQVLQTQPTVNTAQPAQTTPQPSITEGLVQQGTNLSNLGTNITSTPNPQAQNLNNFGNTFFGTSQNAVGQANQQAQSGANAQIGSNAANLIGQQRQGTENAIQNYFSAQPLDTLRSKLAQSDVDRQVSGLNNSRSGNEIQAELQRGLIRDQAQAQLAANQQFNQAELGQLDQQRAANLSLANIFSNQASQQGSLANSATGTAGQLDIANRGQGIDTINQGFQNQLAGLAFGNQIDQQSFENELQRFILQNQLFQQNLQNIQGNKANKFNQKMAQDSLDLAKQQLEASSGGGLLGALGF